MASRIGPCLGYAIMELPLAPTRSESSVAVSSSDLESLVRLYRDFLNGGAAALPRWRGGALSSLVLDRDGWRIDWTTRVRAALAQALETHAETLRHHAEIAQREGKRATSPDLIRTTLLSYWGVTEYPVAMSEILARSGLSESTIRRWQGDALDDTRVLTQLDRSVEPSEPGTASAELRTWTGPADDWPPVTVRDKLLATFRRTHRIVKRSGDREDLLALRAAAAELMLQEYLNAAERTPLYRQFEYRVADEWHGADPLAFAKVADPSDEVSVSVPQATLGALAQWACAEIATRTEHLEAVQEAYGRRDAVGEFLALSEQFTSTNSSGLAMIDLDHAAGRAVVVEHIHAPRTLDLDVGTGFRADTGPTKHPIAHAYDLAKQMRATKPSSPERLELCRQYVKERFGIPAPAESPVLNRGRRAMGRNEPSTAQQLRHQLALADQSASLMLLDEKLYELMGELRIAIKRTGGGEVYNTVLTTRDDGLAFAQQNKHDKGIERILAARVSIANVAAIRTAADRLSVIESLQQTSLAAGGVAVQVVESILRVRSAASVPDGLAAYARAALGWSWDALRLLDQVEKELSESGRRLSATRGAESNISWEGWRSAASVQRLRSQLVVRAAIAAGLLNPAQWNSEALDCTVPSIVDGYSQALGLKQYDRGNANRLIIQSVWLGMLNGGTIPVRRDLAMGLRDMPHYIDPVLLESEDLRFGTFQVARFRKWAIRKKFDLGTLGTLPLDGPVASALEELSGHRYFELRGESPDVRQSSSKRASARRGDRREFDSLGTSPD